MTDHMTAVDEMLDRMIAYGQSLDALAPSELAVGPQSPALRDELDEPNWSAEPLSDPVRNAHMHAAMLVIGVVDHFRALALTLRHTHISPIYAHQTLLRPIFELGIQSVWMNDPRITTAHRIERGLNRDIANAGELTGLGKRMDDGSQLLQMGQRLRDRSRAYAKMFRLKAHRSNPPTMHDGHHLVLPSDSSIHPGTGSMLWGIMSATSHGGAWAMALPMTSFDKDALTGRPLGALTISTANTIESAGYAASVMLEVVSIRLRFLGRDKPAPIAEAELPFLSALSPLLRTVSDDRDRARAQR